MKFEISRDGALKQLDAFINSELANYSFKRNFDLGPKDKKLLFYEWHVQKASEKNCNNCWFTSAVSIPMDQGNTV